MAYPFLFNNKLACLSALSTLRSAISSLLPYIWLWLFGCGWHYSWAEPGKPLSWIYRIFLHSCCQTINAVFVAKTQLQRQQAL